MLNYVPSWFVELFLFFKNTGYGLAFIIVSFLMVILYLIQKISVLKSENKNYLFVIHSYKDLIHTQSSDFEKKTKEMDKLKESLNVALKNIEKKKEL